MIKKAKKELNIHLRTPTKISFAFPLRESHLEEYLRQHRRAKRMHVAYSWCGFLSFNANTPSYMYYI
ncbi:hypothetical protein Y032_0985g3288 [Ancylostoma ceylanicum]|uniref:Uncharacterized protein n=1 Tax=Ancylostoma ceylanicum TaxID=53326 RepID=A0A016W852_9BILA|nr:hypothetical protein Y032_0985g3288 [Ancylostoma ceylanicum]